MAQSTVITGHVKDSETGQALPFSSIGFPSSKTGLTSDSYGTFRLSIPDGTDHSTLVISYLGYKTDTLRISGLKNDYVIRLLPLPENLNEVVVTGASRATLIKENPVSLIQISAKAIDKASESNIIDALVKNAPGLNAVKTGPNISKPFIRGLGYNRVLTLYDGIRQEGQQWGDEHGIEVDAYNIQRAEVIKGPASLLYGSDALAGVVSLMPYIPNEADSILKTRLLSEFQTNNGLIGNGLRLGYRSAHWLFALRGNYRKAKNYTNSIDGRVYNTGFEEKNISMLAGYVSRKGYTHLNVTAYDNLQGIPDGSRDSLTRTFTQQVYEAAADDVKNRPVVPEKILNAYLLSPLHQHIQHYRAYSTHHYQLGKGDMDGLLAFQQNVRREYNHPTNEEQAGMYVKLNTLNYGLRYNAPKLFNIETSLGINGMYQSNQNKNATDFPIPDYHLFDAGAYIYAKWKYRNWAISGGLRYDVRQLTGNKLYTSIDPLTGFAYQSNQATPGAYLQFSSFQKTFGGTSSSLGATYKLSNQVSLKANIARGYRAPSITELASNGLDPGAHIVYLGNRDFTPEFSLQEDLGVSGVFKDFSASLSIFNNTIAHYIYLSQLTDEDGNPVIASQGNKIVQYQQASAQLYGMEATFDIHPKRMSGFSLSNNFSFLYGFNRKAKYTGQGINGEYLPFIPPLKWQSGFSQEIKISAKKIKTITFTAEADYNGAQNRYMALYNTETRTASYCLLNAGASIDLAISKTSTVHLFLQVNNVLNAAYQSNLSRLKYFEYYAPSPGNHSGMYGMGRNFCVKLIFEI